MLERTARCVGHALLAPQLNRELGLLVEDEFQRSGVGTALCDRLVARLPRGATLIAEALFDNRRALNQSSRCGPVRLTHYLGEVSAVVNVLNSGRG